MELSFNMNTVILERIPLIIECNAEYFNQIKNGLIGVTKVVFNINGDGLLYMDTYAYLKKGIRYYVYSDNRLNIKPEVIAINN